MSESKVHKTNKDTNRDQEFRQLSDSEELCQILMMHSPNPVNVINPDNSLQYINPAMEELTGYSAQDVIGRKPPYPWWPEERRAEVKSDLTDAMNKGGVYRLEELYKNRDGEYFTVEVTSKPFYEGKVFKGLVCNWVDLTERKKAEAALKQSQAELEKQKEALERKNVALAEIIEQIEREKNKLKDNISINVEELMIPILEKLRMNLATREYAQLLEHHLSDLVSSYGSRITEKRVKLTPREIELCSMIKSGLTTKEISKLLNISSLTIEKHRNNIRKKLNISKKKVNLASYLQELS